MNVIGSPAVAGFDASPLRRAARWSWAEFGFWLLPVVGWFLFPDDLALLSQIAVAGLFTLSLDLILGYAGIISLGHAGFFGIGGYAAGLLAAHGFGEPLLGLLAAALIAGAVGFLSSFLVLRGPDLTRLMVTLAVASIVYVAANRLTDITGGLDGLQGIEIWPLLGWFEFDLYGRTAYVYSIVVLFVLFWLARRIVHSPFGLSLQGVRQNASRMPAIGTPVRARLIAIYALASAYAGIAGALLTQTSQFISVDQLSFSRSAEVMLMLVLGGAGTLYGGLLGAILFMTAHHLLAGLNAQYWQFWLGILLILVVLFGRGGLMGGLAAARRRLERRAA